MIARGKQVGRIDVNDGGLEWVIVDQLRDFGKPLESIADDSIDVATNAIPSAAAGGSAISRAADRRVNFGDALFVHVNQDSVTGRELLKADARPARERFDIKPVRTHLANDTLEDARLPFGAGEGHSFVAGQK